MGKSLEHENIESRLLYMLFIGNWSENEARNISLKILITKISQSQLFHDFTKQDPRANFNVYGMFKWSTC